jgi:hypothetical protein
LAFLIEFSFSLFVTFLFKNLSIIRPAIGAAQAPPAPAFSTKTAKAILGLSIGAKAMKTEWFFLFLPFQIRIPIFLRNLLCLINFFDILLKIQL